ncbi:MAG: hypothetical protein IT384_28205 [Deltaproteobacteria bacterium]|nr:hypothetical protein [Deltaproteobacteria bacterium]
MSAQLDIHWSALLPELERAADAPTRQLKARFEAAERRARDAAESASKSAELIRIDYLRKRRLFATQR